MATIIIFNPSYPTVICCMISGKLEDCINNNTLIWTVHLAKLYPLRSVLVILSIAITALAGIFFIGIIPGLIASFALIAALADFLAPVTYTITSEYAEVKQLTGTKRIPWTLVAFCASSQDALKVSTVSEDSKLSPFRSITFHYNSNRDEVVEIVEKIRGNKS